MSTGPAQAFPVGEHLLEELEARGWTQAEFAEILARPPQVVSEIISGKKEITRESAAQIGAALGTSAEYWLNLQDAYHLWRQRQDERNRQQLEEVRLRARLKELAPVAVLRKRGVITETTTRGQAEQLRRLFGLESIFDDPLLPIAARRSNLSERVSPTQSTWLACVRREAERLAISPYSSRRYRALCERLSRDMGTPSAFSDLPHAFAESGVRLVYVEAFPASKIDGASFLLGKAPVIGLSGRGHRLDKVLFTLLHEAAHIVLDHIADGVILDDEHCDALEQEQDADELAAHWALPQGLPDIPDRIGQTWLLSTASTLGVHPIVVVGRLQKAGVITWRSALAKDAPTVTRYLQDW